MKTIKGPGDLPGAVRRRRARRSTRSTRSPTGPPASATRACRSRPGTAACSTSKKAAESKTYCDEVKGTLRAARPRRSPSCRPTCRASSSPCIPAYDAGFDGFAAPRGARQPGRRAGVGGRADEAGRQGVAPTSASTAHATLLRRAGLALPLSLAAAAGRSDRDRVRRAGQALAADPRRLRRGRRRRLLRDPSRRGPARRRDLRDVPRARRQPPARLHPLRPEPLRAAAARLSRLHRHLPRAHQDVPRQGRRVQSDRPAGRLWRLSSRWVDRAGRFRSLGDGQVDFAAIFSKLAALRLSPAGRCWNGNAA